MSCLTFQWGTATKGAPCGSSLFVGTSPAFEIALFSACFLQYPGKPCGCTIDTSSIEVQTYSVATGTGAAVATAFPAGVSSLGEHFELHRDHVDFISPRVSCHQKVVPFKLVQFLSVWAETLHDNRTSYF